MSGKEVTAVPGLHDVPEAFLPAAPEETFLSKIPIFVHHHQPRIQSIGFGPVVSHHEISVLFHQDLLSPILASAPVIILPEHVPLLIGPDNVHILASRPPGSRVSGREISPIGKEDDVPQGVDRISSVILVPYLISVPVDLDEIGIPVGFSGGYGIPRHHEPPVLQLDGPSVRTVVGTPSKILIPFHLSDCIRFHDVEIIGIPVGPSRDQVAPIGGGENMVRRIV